MNRHGLHHLLVPHEENERIVHGVNESQFFHVGCQPVEVAAIRLVDDPAQVEEANGNEIRTGRDEERRHSDNQRSGGLHFDPGQDFSIHVNGQRSGVSAAAVGLIIFNGRQLETLVVKMLAAVFTQVSPGQPR